MKEQDELVLIVSRNGLKTAIEKIVCLAITLRLINGFYVCEC